jgi:hypothetical protein
MPPPVKTLSLSDLGMISLRSGDNDAQRRWGGQPQLTMSGTPVTELQKALVAVGLLSSADGAFGHHTQVALKQFLWYLRNMDYRLKLPPRAHPSAGHIMTFAASVGSMPGTCDKSLATELIAWRDGNFIATTPLVRLNTAPLSNVQTGPTFTVLGPAGEDEVIVHEDFADVVATTMNDAASKLKVKLSINQTFRDANVPPSGTVVTPANKSQHLIGHAVDLNILDADSFNSTANYKAGTETDSADSFVKAMIASGLRWGGNFADSCSKAYDPIHYDDFVDPHSEDWEMTYFFAQRCFKARHPMRTIG